MKEPSDKQIVFACWISQVTGKQLPKENTAQAYFLYIQENIQQYKKIRSEKRKNNVYNYHKLPRKHLYNSVMDDEQDASWAAAMDFDWM